MAIRETRIKYLPHSGWLGRSERAYYRNQYIARSVPRDQTSPLPYDLILGEISDLKLGKLKNGSPFELPDAINTFGGGSNVSSMWTSYRRAVLKNKAYDRMVSRVSGERSQLAASIAEGRQSLEMIANRSTQLFQAYRSLKRGRFKEFLQTLHLDQALPKHKSKRWNKPKEASGLWLEYWFGWSPLVADISNAVEILQGNSPIPKKKSYFSGARDRYPGNADLSRRGTRRIFTGTFSMGVRYGIDVEVINPNENQASRLGFTNAASVVWELVPFSFLVDWFIPIGKFLNRYEDWLGLRRSNNYYTEYYRYDGKSENVLMETADAGTTTTFTRTYVDVRRRLGDISPLPLPAVGRLSVTRAATSIALLLSVFSGRLPNPNRY